jgi:thioredoxin 2
MNAESIQIVCPHDAAVNRVPIARLAESPRCGKCHEQLFAGEPFELSVSNFDRHLTQSQIPLLVDFWAPWCGPCRMMAPAFAKAAALVEPRLRLAKLNTEEEPALSARFAIRSIPTLVLFAQGRELARHSGAVTSAQEIAKWAVSRLQA